MILIKPISVADWRSATPHCLSWNNRLYLFLLHKKIYIIENVFISDSNSNIVCDQQLQLSQLQLHQIQHDSVVSAASDDFSSHSESPYHNLLLSLPDGPSSGNDELLRWITT